MLDPLKLQKLPSIRGTQACCPLYREKASWCRQVSWETTITSVNPVLIVLEASLSAINPIPIVRINLRDYLCISAN